MKGLATVLGTATTNNTPSRSVPNLFPTSKLLISNSYFASVKKERAKMGFMGLEICSKLETSTMSVQIIGVLYLTFICLAELNC
jgi:hypothetical protein